MSADGSRGAGVGISLVGGEISGTSFSLSRGIMLQVGVVHACGGGSVCRQHASSCMRGRFTHASSCMQVRFTLSTVSLSSVEEGTVHLRLSGTKIVEVFCTSFSPSQLMANISNDTSCGGGGGGVSSSSVLQTSSEAKKAQANAPISTVYRNLTPPATQVLCTPTTTTQVSAALACNKEADAEIAKKKFLYHRGWLPKGDYCEDWPQGVALPNRKIAALLCARSADCGVVYAFSESETIWSDEAGGCDFGVEEWWRAGGCRVGGTTHVQKPHRPRTHVPKTPPGFLERVYENGTVYDGAGGPAACTSNHSLRAEMIANRSSSSTAGTRESAASKEGGGNGSNVGNSTARGPNDSSTGNASSANSSSNSSNGSSSPNPRNGSSSSSPNSRNNSSFASLENVSYKHSGKGLHTLPKSILVGHQQQHTVTTARPVAVLREQLHVHHLMFHRT